jgi:tRNA(Ile2) C34 agmatinyltransferase TiaS
MPEMLSTHLRHEEFLHDIAYCNCEIELSKITVVKLSEYEGGTFRCRVCGKEFLTRGEGDRHYREVHDNERTEIGE